MSYFSCEEIRNIADIKCQKNAGKLALIFLLYSFLTVSISFDEEKFPKLVLVGVGITLALLIIRGAMEYGISKVIKENYQEEKASTDSLFSGFFKKPIVAFYLQFLYTFLWTLLFIVPGIIKAIAYIMTYYVMLDNPELSAKECITKSKEMMEGNKWNYFKLTFSYFGWWVLCILTFGILYLWIGPKMKTAQYDFYLKVSGKNRVIKNNVLY